VDLQDEHGDTALNIAARIGNRALVKTLVDVGANRLLANKLGLRPSDFGVEGEVWLRIIDKPDRIFTELIGHPASHCSRCNLISSDKCSGPWTEKPGNSVG